jgi:hypothetical protein
LKNLIWFMPETGNPRHPSSFKPGKTAFSQRSGAAKSSRPWQLPDGLVNVAQLRQAMVRPEREKLFGVVEVDETDVLQLCSRAEGR